MKTKIVTGLVGFFLLLAVVSMTYLWYKEKNKPPTSTVQYVTVEKVKTVEKIKKVEVPGPERIITIEKEKIVEKINLPDWFSKDKDEQAIATGVIEPYKGKTDVIATLNTKTGIGNIIAKQEPLSFFGFGNDKELYGKLGYSTTKEMQVVVGGRFLFVRVGGFKVGAYAEGRAGFSTNESKGTQEATAGLMITY